MCDGGDFAWRWMKYSNVNTCCQFCSISARFHTQGLVCSCCASNFTTIRFRLCAAFSMTVLSCNLKNHESIPVFLNARVSCSFVCRAVQGGKQYIRTHMHGEHTESLPHDHGKRTVKGIMQEECEEGVLDDNLRWTLPFFGCCR